MVFFKYIAIIVVATASFCYSQDMRNGNRVKRADDQATLQNLYNILLAQNEKITRLHTLTYRNQFMAKCTTLVAAGNINLGSKCWKDMISGIRIYDESPETENKLLGELITEAYNGDKTKLLSIVQFIQNNVEKGSNQANSTYSTLLNEMDYHDHLYLKQISLHMSSGGGLIDYTYRTLIAIGEAEGETSPILPIVLNSIVKEKDVFIRNSVTKEFLFASRANSSSSKVMLSSNNGKGARYTWKLSPVESEWNDRNREVFYIKNGNKILAVDDDDDGSLIVTNATAQRLKSNWAMFYIRLVRGTSGEEVAIQCSYWGIKTLAVNVENSTPKLLTLQTVETNPTAVWLLQPKSN